MGFRTIYRKCVEPIVKIRDERYEADLCRRLNKDSFSIICSTCIGGVIYHRLGKQFQSPTINLWIGDLDFLKFIHRLKYYLSQELVLEKYLPGGERGDYPVGRLDDVLIHFNHDNSFEQAKLDWERRLTRVDHESLYFIVRDSEKYTLKDIKDLVNIDCRRLIVLSSKKYDGIEYVKTIKPRLDRLNGKNYLDKDFLLRRTFEKEWDFVAWLNGE